MLKLRYDALGNKKIIQKYDLISISYDGSAELYFLIETNSISGGQLWCVADAPAGVHPGGGAGREAAAVPGTDARLQPTRVSADGRRRRSEIHIQ